MRRNTGALADVLRASSFRDFWLAFTFSNVGDLMTKTALVWYVFERSRSTVEVGLLLLARIIHAGRLLAWGARRAA
jgi:hypothetical protein